jgi:hypothetical protein
VNFNINFNVLLSKYIVHPLLKIKKTLISNIMFRKRQNSSYSLTDNTMRSSLKDKLVNAAYINKSLFIIIIHQNSTPTYTTIHAE